MSTPSTTRGRYGFAGSGIELLGVEIVSTLIGLFTCGLGFFLGVSAARRRLWLATHATRDGGCFRYECSFGDALGFALVNILLWVFTLGLATPWIVARTHAFRAAHTHTHDGRRVRFDGSGTEVLGLCLLTVLALPFTLGLALPWIAVEWRRWSVHHTLIEDPMHPTGAIRLRFDGSALGMLVQTLLGMILTLLTLGLYVPWARVNFERWAWSATSEEDAPRLDVPLGPRTPAEWAVVAMIGVGILGTVSTLALIALSASGHSVSSPFARRNTDETPAYTAERSPTAAGSVAAPSGCSVTSGPRVVGRRASVASLELLARDGRLGLGWVSPGHRLTRGATGDDDSAAVELRTDGTLAQVIDPEDPGRVGMQFERRIEHVYALPSGGGVGVRIDEIQSGEAGASMSCGGLRGLLSSITVGDTGMTERCDLGDLYDCSTLAEPSPFVLGVLAPGDVFDRDPLASVVALRAGEPRNTAPLWTLPLHRLRRAECATRLLHRTQGLEGVHSASLAGGATAVAFRWHQALYVGVVDASLRPLGALQRVATLGGEVGRPRLASNGREALLVFADREPTPPHERHMPAPEAPPYRIHALRVSAERVSGAVRVETVPAPEYDEFAPSVASLPDGSWLLVWSQGERHPRGADAPMQRVFLRRYRDDLGPVGDALELSPGVTASDARVATVGSDFVVALAVGRGSAREVSTLGGRCAAP